jgi:hypothetical protein
MSCVHQACISRLYRSTHSACVPLVRRCVCDSPAHRQPRRGLAPAHMFAPRSYVLQSHTHRATNSRSQPSPSAPLHPRSIPSYRLHRVRPHHRHSTSCAATGHSPVPFVISLSIGNVDVLGSGMAWCGRARRSGTSIKYSLFDALKAAGSAICTRWPTMECLVWYLALS